MLVLLAGSEPATILASCLDMDIDDAKQHPWLEYSVMIRSGCGYTLQDIFNDGTAGALCLMSLRIRFVNGGG